MGGRHAATSKKYAITLAIAAFVSVSAGAFVVFCDYAAVAPWGSASFKMLQMPMLLPLLASVAVVPGALIGTLIPSMRSIGLRVLLSSVVFFVIVFASFQISANVRSRAFRALATRSGQLVEAIRAHEQKYGQPPSSLDAIVPEFLPSVPSTGMGAYPAYAYYVGKEERYDGNPWILEVFTPTGVLNFDRFLYYPRQNYADWCCGSPEPIGDWVYIHE